MVFNTFGLALCASHLLMWPPASQIYFQVAYGVRKVGQPQSIGYIEHQLLLYVSLCAFSKIENLIPNEVFFVRICLCTCNKQYGLSTCKRIVNCNAVKCDFNSEIS